jgi:hypothetical protein
MTILLWILWNIYLAIRLPKGISIGDEIGKFNFKAGAGWNYVKNLIKPTAALNTEDSSPHILIAGGSQSGKSTAIKTILSKLVRAPGNPIIQTLRKSIPPILAVLILLFLILTNPALFVTPIIIIAYVIQHGSLSQESVYLAWIILGFVVIGIAAALLLHLRKEHERIVEHPGSKRGNIILDYHGEYGFLKEDGFAIINAADYDPLAQNHDDESFENIVSDFVDAFLVAFETTGDVQLAILKKRLMETKDVKTALSEISKGAGTAKSYNEQDRLTGLFLRLEKIAAYNGNMNIRDLSGGCRNIVFDLSGIRDRDAADFFAENILSRYMASITRNGKQDGINIVIDEAHRLNTKPLADRGFETITSRIARESGKFGGRLIIASQNLGDFPSGFSANFGNILCFRSPSGTEQGSLEKMTGISQGTLQSVMNGLVKGEVLLISPNDHCSVVKVKS